MPRAVTPVTVASKNPLEPCTTRQSRVGPVQRLSDCVRGATRRSVRRPRCLGPSMASLTFKAEWEPAPGVVHPALARTWARLEIAVGDRYATTVLDHRAGATRTGVYALGWADAAGDVAARTRWRDPRTEWIARRVDRPLKPRRSTMGPTSPGAGRRESLARHRWPPIAAQNQPANPRPLRQAWSDSLGEDDHGPRRIEDDAFAHAVKRRVFLDENAGARCRLSRASEGFHLDEEDRVRSVL